MTRINVYQYPAPDDYKTSRERVGSFDYSKAEKWSDRDHNGNGSGGTGAGQAVLRTAKGKWVLENWTLWQGQEDRYEYLTEDEAREWLLCNNFDEAVKEHFGDIEEEEDRRPGRPPVGKGGTLRLGDERAARADTRAAQEGITRAELIRRAVDQYIATPAEVR